MCTRRISRWTIGCAVCSKVYLDVQWTWRQGWTSSPSSDWASQCQTANRGEKCFVRSFPYCCIYWCGCHTRMRRCSTGLQFGTGTPVDPFLAVLLGALAFAVAGDGCHCKGSCDHTAARFSIDDYASKRGVSKTDVLDWYAEREQRHDEGNVHARSCTLQPQLSHDKRKTDSDSLTGPASPGKAGRPRSRPAWSSATPAAARHFAQTSRQFFLTQKSAKNHWISRHCPFKTDLRILTPLSNTFCLLHSFPKSLTLSDIIRVHFCDVWALLKIAIFSCLLTCPILGAYCGGLAEAFSFIFTPVLYF